MSLSRPDSASVDPPALRQNAAKRVEYLDGENVRRLALSAGFASDEALARAAALSYGHLWSCLSGRCGAGPKVLAGLLRALPGATLLELVANGCGDAVSA